MEQILIKCVSGYTAPLESFTIYDSLLKKHSLLEIERLEESIVKNGFLFPMLVGKLNGKMYVIDGECRLIALHNLKNRGYEIPEIPYCLTKVTEQNFKRILLDNISVNHAVTEVSLKRFAEGTDLNLKAYGFTTPDLIDFLEPKDITIYESVLGGKIVKDGIKLKKEDFYGLLGEML